jgi:hypothetical protein
MSNNINLNQEDAKSQNRLILKHLRTGATITGMEALSLYGCFRLPSRICDLKNAGHKIVSRFIKTPSGKRVKEYKLV